LQKQKKILIISVLSILFVLSLVRIIFFIEQVSRQSLQLDFTAYYTAGKVLNNGLSPYKNYITQDWNLWDGVAQYKHGRFLYTPIAGNFFQPLAKFHYSTAKHIWNYLNFIFIIISVFIWLKISRFDKNIIAILSAGIFTFNFFPLYTLLERGQIDGLTFLLLTLGIFFSIKKKSLYAGIFFAFASIFKFYSLLALPFLLLKKKFSTVVSFVISFVVIICAMYILNGTTLVNDYIFNQLPRISQYGEMGPEESKIDSWILKNYFTISRYAISLIEGQFWVSESISFYSNASLKRLITAVEKKSGLSLSSSVWSLLLFILIFIIIAKNIKTHKEFYLWITIILVILVCSPFTWVMNLVWVIPVIFVIFNFIAEGRYKNYIFGLIAGGLFIMSFPDDFDTSNFLLTGFFQARYIIGNLLILTGMLLTLRSEKFKTSVSESLR
jgi:hypothetical protein